eukprot:scaffold70230_cov25-Tisochrysis_lutea.AAC.2
MGKVDRCVEGWHQCVAGPTGICVGGRVSYLRPPHLEVAEPRLEPCPGIVCLVHLGGERQCAFRLLNLLTELGYDEERTPPESPLRAEDIGVPEGRAPGGQPGDGGARFQEEPAEGAAPGRAWMSGG